MSLTMAIPSGAGAAEPRVVTIDSAGPLLYFKVMIKAGSAMDPQGLEGLAYLTGRLLIDGGFGDAKKPVTKEQLAEMTQPWGEGAYPTVRVEKETTTFSMTIPRERLAEYSARVLKPLFSEPLFSQPELNRLRAETLDDIRSNLRFQQIELLGLLALDIAIYEGTSYAHLGEGTVQGLEAVSAASAHRFYRTWYRPDNLTLAVSTSDLGVIAGLREAFGHVGESAKDVAPFPPRSINPPKAVAGRRVTIIGLPKAIATGLHMGFPISVTRADSDYWPLFVANVWFGTHRDSFSHLYQVIRNERGYNYGDYSYIEHFEGRPYYLFPPTNTPRHRQYFSIWVRPVANDYAHHLMKAATWELENLVRNGLTLEDVDAAKNKARVLYLSYAENVDRLVGYRLDDDFYGLAPGYLEQYLARIDAVTPEAVNAAIRKHLQVQNLEYVLITDQGLAEKLPDDIAADRNALGKSLKDYQLDSEERGGTKYWLVSTERLEMLRRDVLWEAYRLNIPRSNIHIVKADQMFETAGLPK
jgi:zinc protease